jgi:predicted DNA-binding transcriptional regulator AlpA
MSTVYDSHSTFEPKDDARNRALVDGEITIGVRRFASAKRIASLLGVSVRTLSRWDAEGKGPPKIKIGKKTFFDIDDVSEWLSSQVTPASPGKIER